MDVVVHIGGHHAGHAGCSGLPAASGGCAIWGPLRTRDGLFSGMSPARQVLSRRDGGRRVAGRVALALDRARRDGAQTLLVSDPDLAGNPWDNLRAGRLHPAAGERMARLAAAFGQRIGTIVINLRAPDRYWATAAAQAVCRGHPVPGPERFAAMAQDRRGWRDVITDIACAVPGADVRVVLDGPARPASRWVTEPENAAAGVRALAGPAPSLPELRRILADRGEDPGRLPQGDGAWQPFAKADLARLHGAYSRDLAWLADGAEGVATLTEDGNPQGQGENARPAADERGRRHDDEGRLGQAGRG